MADALRFADFELRLDSRRLLARGAAVPLGARAFDLLQVLVEECQRPVSKGELLDRVWPDQDIEEGNLPVQVSTLRKLLGPQAIATVPGLGYRFMLPVEGDLAPPPIASTPPARHNLPWRPATLLGRDAELAELHTELDRAALVSLVGPSGIGKTRLAQAACQDVATQSDVWWVDLAEVDDASMLTAAVGATFGLGVDRATDPLAALANGLRHQRCLVALDNCEHLVGAVAALVQRLLVDAPGVRWLLTSQESTRLPLEVVMRVEPLEVPAAGTPWPQAAQAGAIALLQARAGAVDRRFRLDEGNIAAAIEICARLDGVPLAIEMAAARLPRLGLTGVRDRLDERLRLLAADDRLVAARHRSLQAALDWSHGLLEEGERIALRRLAVFAGGFTLESAQQMLDGDDSPWDAIDTLVALVDKSLVQVEGATDCPRYRLLESTRLFAQARLVEAAEAAAVARRHAQVVAQMAMQATAQLWTQTDQRWLARWAPEVDNLRLALGWSVRAGEAATVAPLFEMLDWVDSLQGGGTAVRAWCAPVEALLELAEPSVAAQLRMGLGATLRNHAPQRTLEHYGEAARVYRSLGDGARLYRALCGLAIQCARVGQITHARGALVEAQSLLSTEWPARMRVLEADAAGFVSTFEGDRQAARQHYRRMRAMALQGGVDGALTVVSVNLADLALALGDADEAVRIGREHVAWLRRRRESFGLGWALGNLCAALLRSGALDEAEQAGREALGLMRRAQHAAWLFDHYALLAARRGDVLRAAQLVGYADAARERTGSVREPIEAQARDETVDIATRQCGLQACAELRRQGAALDDEQADALAFAHGAGPEDVAALRSPA